MTTNDRTTNDRTTMRWGGQQGDGARGGASGRSGPQGGRPGPAGRSGRSGPTGPSGSGGPGAPGGPGGPSGPGGPTGGPVAVRGPEERADWQERLALRNWSLPVKLAAVLLVPTVFVVSLGVLRIVEQTEKASSYDGVQQSVSLEDRTSRLLSDLSAERTASAVYVASRRAGGPALVKQRADASENTADDWRQAANRADSLDDQARSAYGDAANGLQQLYRLRTEVQSGRVDPAGVLARYSEEINALLAFDRSLTREAADPSVAGLAGGLYSLSVVREEDAYVQAVVAAGIAAGRIDAPSIDEARNATLRRTIAVDDFRAAVGTDNDRLADAVVGPDVDARDRLAQVVLGRGSAGLPLQVAGPEWQRVSDAVTARVADTSAQLRGQLQANAQALQDGARNAAGIASVVLLLALIAGAAVVFFVTRSLLRPLRLLRRTALDVAERRLPGAVRSLREGEAPDTDVAPTPIRTREEIGQVARAFDQVHEQAVRLAAEQAGLRSAFNSIFINLSRRSQALVERQLRLIEQLENNEEDPESLSNLFQLDHLATRMRRNSENLLVLSGTDLSRRGTRPVPVVDVLRAAASEVEQYQRVDLQPPPNVMLLGRTASDVVHLVAELLENATTFSAPDTRVDVVVTQAADGGLAIDIADAGVGMTAVDMRDANTRLASPPTVDVSASRRMGLFVVGRLAIRHGITVVLRDRDPAGIVASVTVPANAILAAMPAGGQRPPEQVGGARRGGAAALGAGAAGAAMLAGAAGGAASSGSSGPGADAPSGTGTIQRQERANGRPALPSRTGGDRAAGDTGSGDSGGPATSFFDPGASRSGGNASEPADRSTDAGSTNGSSTNGNGSSTNGNGSSAPGNGTSGGADGDLPRRGPRNVLGNLPTRNGRRFPPPGSDTAGASSGAGTAGTNGHGAAATNGAGTNGANGTGANATNGHAPTNGHAHPGAEGGLPRRGPRPLGPVEEVPPPADADAPATPEPSDEADDADDRVATTTPEASDASGVTVWRAGGGDQEQAGPGEPAATEDGEDDGGEQAGRHGWRRPPPAEGPPVPSSGSPQHRLGPPSRPTPAPPAGRPGAYPQPPYPPPPGWAPGRPPAGSPTPPERRGPVPAGAETPSSDRPVAGAAPTRGASTPDAPESTGTSGIAAAGAAAAGAAALGVAGASAWHRARRPGTGSTENPAPTPAPTSAPTSAPAEAAPTPGSGPTEAPAGSGVQAPSTTDDAPADDTSADQARSRRARALPMTVRRGAVPLRPQETSPEQEGAADAERAASPAPEPASPEAAATTAPEAPAPGSTPAAASSAPSATASPEAVTPDSATEPGTEAGPRPLGRRRGPTGGLVPPPSSTPRLRPRRPEAAGEQSADGAGADENGEDGLFAPQDDEQPNGTHAPELPRRPAGVPNGTSRPAAGATPGAPPRAVPERLPLRAGTAGRERTPIFDEVASVWFREGTPGEAQAEDWQTTGDAGWRAAAASTEAADGGTTEAGLPRRRPRARLVPGAADSASGARATAPGVATARSSEASVATNGANGASATGAQPKVGANGANGANGSSGANGSNGSGGASGPRRNPDAVRGRLASYQRGVNEGRSSRRGPNANGDGDRPGDEEEQ